MTNLLRIVSAGSSSRRAMSLSARNYRSQLGLVRRVSSYCLDSGVGSSKSSARSAWPARGMIDSSSFRIHSAAASADSVGGSIMPPCRFFSTSEQEQHEKDFEFQAETRQLLDIVTHSLYTEKEVFLRELVSNASDALEKLRHLQAGGSEIKTIDADVPLEIRIETDEMNGTLTISDTGIGLTRDELVTNLGTIARSGSKQFVSELASQQDGNSIIGKFGVGFYSSFMVGDTVEVRSKSAIKDENDEDAPAQVWSSTGHGSFKVSDLAPDIRQDRGSSVVIHLKDDELQYSDEKTIEKVLQKYSNFVSFPIYLNGNRVNTMEAIWTKDSKDVKEETYVDFYKYIAHAMDEPLEVPPLHFRADAPLEIKALLYIPSFHSEKYGMGRMEPGVSLYSRKVLIEAKSPDILPDWLRFVKGVVDSEDLPLSISREKAQDSALIAKLRKALTRKFVSHLTTMAKKRPKVYLDEFYREYSYFLKEGICQDHEFQEALAKLLRFETSKQLNLELCSLDEYISRCEPDQKEIYYLCAPSRELALESPYLEAFEKAGREVIFVYSAIDDFVMANLGTYQGRNLVSAEKGDIDFGKNEEDSSEDKDSDENAVATKLSDADAFCAWFQMTLGDDKVAGCKVTSRLTSSPAVIVDNESGAMRRMMRMVDTQEIGRDAMPLPKQQVEINPSHPVILGMEALRETEPALAKVCAQQVFDNCLVAAGLLDDSRSMLPRINDILLSLLRGAQEQQAYNEDKKEATMAGEAEIADNDKSSLDSDNSNSEKEDKDKSTAEQ